MCHCRCAEMRQMLSVHATVSEWLRRWTRNPLGSARRGSNPLGVDVAASVPQYVCVISYKHVSRQLRRCGPCCNNQRTQESATNRRSIMTRERERGRERERERERRRHAHPRCQTADVYEGEGVGLLCASRCRYCCTPALASTLFPAMAQGTRKT